MYANPLSTPRLPKPQSKKSEEKESPDMKGEGKGMEKKS